MDKHAEKNMQKYVDKYVKSHTVVHRKGSMIFAIASSAIAASGITCGAIFIPKALAAQNYNGPKIQEKAVNHSIELETQSDNYQLYTFSIDSDKVTSENLSGIVQVTSESGIHITTELAVIVQDKNVYTYLNYNSSNASYGDITKFNIVFTYSDGETSLAQTFKNFELKYNQIIGDAELERDAYCYANAASGTRQLWFKNNIETLNPKNFEIFAALETAKEEDFYIEDNDPYEAHTNDETGYEDVPDGYFAIDLKYSSTNTEDKTLKYSISIDDKQSNKITTFKDLYLTTSLKGIVPASKTVRAYDTSFTYTINLPQFDYNKNYVNVQIVKQTPQDDFIDGQIEIIKVIQPTEGNLFTTLNMRYVNNNVIQFGRIKFDLEVVVKDRETENEVTRQTISGLGVNYFGSALKQDYGNKAVREFNITPNAPLDLIRYKFTSNFAIPGADSKARTKYLNERFQFYTVLSEQSNFVPVISSIEVESCVNDNFFEIVISLKSTPEEIKKHVGTSGSANLYLVIGFLGGEDYYGNQIIPFRSTFKEFKDKAGNIPYRLKVNYNN